MPSGQSRTPSWGRNLIFYGASIHWLMFQRLSGPRSSAQCQKCGPRSNSLLIHQAVSDSFPLPLVTRFRRCGLTASQVGRAKTNSNEAFDPVALITLGGDEYNRTEFRHIRRKYCRFQLDMSRLNLESSSISLVEEATTTYGRALHICHCVLCCS
jgi:hypothetical protein